MKNVLTLLYSAFSDLGFDDTILRLITLSSSSRSVVIVEDNQAMKKIFPSTNSFCDGLWESDEVKNVDIVASFHGSYEPANLLKMTLTAFSTALANTRQNPKRWVTILATGTFAQSKSYYQSVQGQIVEAGQQWNCCEYTLHHLKQRTNKRGNIRHVRFAAPVDSVPILTCSHNDTCS